MKLWAIFEESFEGKRVLCTCNKEADVMDITRMLNSYAARNKISKIYVWRWGTAEEFHGGK